MIFGFAWFIVKIYSGSFDQSLGKVFCLLAPAVTVGETEGAMDSTSGFFLPLLLPITL